MNFITKEDELKLDAPIQALYFYANWQPFHNKFLTMIDKIETKYSDILFTAIDVDHFNSQCKRFFVTSIPTLVIFKNGKEIKRIIGVVLTSAFKSAFADIYNS